MEERNQPLAKALGGQLFQMKMHLATKEGSLQVLWGDKLKMFSVLFLGELDLPHH